MNKQSARTKNAELLKDFVAAFPLCLDLDKPKPLAIGIFEHMSTTFETKRLRKALLVYTNRKQYLTALIAEGAFRVNVDGSSAGEVNSEQMQEAKLKLNLLLEKRKKTKEMV